MDVMTNYSRFFINESCGLCTPCRAGNYLIGKKIRRIRRRKAAQIELQELRDWAQIIKKTSRCGLGKTSTNFILNALDKFPQAFEELINDNGNELEEVFNVNEFTHDYADFAEKMNSNG
jgi:[NiFe] hydrogenase diaphorase moiety large subunit